MNEKVMWRLSSLMWLACGGVYIYRGDWGP